MLPYLSIISLVWHVVENSGTDVLVNCNIRFQLSRCMSPNNEKLTHSQQRMGLASVSDSLRCAGVSRQPIDGWELHPKTIRSEVPIPVEMAEHV